MLYCIAAEVSAGIDHSMLPAALAGIHVETDPRCREAANPRYTYTEDTVRDGMAMPSQHM